MAEILEKISKIVDGYMRYRRTIKELSNLSNRDLADIGISRCDIHNVATQSLLAHTSHV